MRDLGRLQRLIETRQDYFEAAHATTWLCCSPHFDDLPRPCLFCYALVFLVRPRAELPLGYLSGYRDTSRFMWLQRQLELPLSA